MTDFAKLRELIPADIELMVFDSLDSTNDYAGRIVRQGSMSDCVIIAKEQIRG